MATTKITLSVPRTILIRELKKQGLWGLWDVGGNAGKTSRGSRGVRATSAAKTVGHRRGGRKMSKSAAGRLGAEATNAHQ